MKVPQWKRKAMVKKVAALGRRRIGLRRGVIGRGLRQPVQYFKRSSWNPGLIAAGGGGVTNWSLVPTLNDVPNVSEFTSLYDMYQIKGVKVTLFPKFSQVENAFALETQQGATQFTINAMGQVLSVIDPDGIAGTYNTTDLVQYQNLKITRGNKLHSRYFKPSTAMAVNNGGTYISGAIKKNVWIDCARLDVNHFGCYGIIDLTGISVNCNASYDVKVDYYLAFKNVR